MAEADPLELQALVDSKCRRDFASFAIRAFPILEGHLIEPAWHIFVICRLLEKAYEGDVRRALVCIPPRYLKTYLITVAFTAWLLGKDPKTKIICASYGASLTEKFSTQTLKLMRSNWYRRIFPNTHLDPKMQNKTEIATTAGGYILPAIQPKAQDYDIVKGGLKVRFVAGRILQPSRHDKEGLEFEKQQMGEQNFEAQFNQSPLPPGGATFKEEWINRYETPPKPSQIMAIIQSWDTAYEGDEENSYSACTTWAKCADGYYLVDVWRGHPSFPDLVKKVYELKKQYKVNMVIVENKASGISLIETIKKPGPLHWLWPIAPEKGKVERAQQQAVKFEQGKVWLPTEAEWLPAYETELFQFPYGKHDDQVDSTVQLLTATDYARFHHLLKQL